jgi:hypothetical protein
MSWRAAAAYSPPTSDALRAGRGGLVQPGMRIRAERGRVLGWTTCCVDSWRGDMLGDEVVVARPDSSTP